VALLARAANHRPTPWKLTRARQHLFRRDGRAETIPSHTRTAPGRHLWPDARIDSLVVGVSCAELPPGLETDTVRLCSHTLDGMTIQRMDHVGVVVDDLAAAVAFFMELGLEVEGEGPASVEGRWVDRVVGLEGVRVDIVFVRTPDGHGRLELTKFHAPRPFSAPRSRSPPLTTPTTGHQRPSRRAGRRREISLADLAFPPQTVTALVHAAYRHWLGFRPFPATPRPDWTWPD